MIRLRTLGGADLTDAEGRELRPVLAQPKRFALLAYLALASSSRFRRRDTVVALFWPELDQEHARGALRQALTFLRRELGDGVMVTRAEEEVGVDPACLICDALQFDLACEAGRSGEAMEHYRGDFLEGLFIADAAPELEQWMDEERARLRRRAAQAAWSLAEERRARGDNAAAAEWGRRATTFSANDEGELRRLIGLLDGLGDRAGAVRKYEEFARHLAREFQVEPSAETQAQIQAVRTRDRAGANSIATAQAPVVGPAGVAAPATPSPKPAPRGRRNVLLLFAIAGVVAIAGYVVAFSGGLELGAERPTVAVLPLEDLGSDTAEAYIADGATEQLITDLARIGTLEVISRRTMLSYRGSSQTTREIARERGADAVLAGTLRRLGDTVRMTAQLTRADGDRVLWAQTYEGTRGELLRIQGEVARAVAQQLRRDLTPAQHVGLAEGRALDPAALDLYIRGRYWWNKRGRAGLLQSIQLFIQALDIDPTFALAYSGMADAYVQLGYGSLLRPDDAFPKAEEAARRALELDSTLAEPHATLGYVNMYYHWDWAAADGEFRRAIALNPSYATAHEWYGLFLAAMGRFDEALAHERRAQKLDPLSVAVTGTAAWVLNYSGRLEDAEREVRIALRMEPTFEIGHLYLGRIYQAQGRLDSALAQYAATGRLRNWIPTIAGYGYVYALQGRRQEARAVLERMDSISQGEYVTSYAMALVHAALGQTDSAFAWLDRGFQERTHWLVWLRRDRRWVPLRPDPRFEALASRVGLPP